MPRNGSGTYNLPPGINPVVTQTLITSNWANTTMNDIATALSQSIAADGQTIPTANLPMGGFRHTNVGDPTAPNQYATLSIVQSGQTTRLTNVSGTNAITANLIGGGTSFQVGQLVQLIPAASNTGPVTLAVNGGAAAPVVTAAGNQLGNGNLIVGRPYILAWTGASWAVLTGVDVSNFAQSSISGWDRPANGIYPDILPINANTVQIPAGTGRIIQPSTRDITTVQEVSWPQQNVVLTNIANAWETTLAINASGQVVQFIGNVQSAWARNNVILGVIGHINGTVQTIINKPVIYGDAAYLAYDLGVLFRNKLISGGSMAANGGNPLHLDIRTGQLWNVGLNADQKDSPNIFTFPDQININFYPVTGISGVGAITNTAPITNYDPTGAGVVTPIPGGGPTSVIHRLFLVSGQFVWSYGQNTYADLDTAVANIPLDNSIYVKPAKMTSGTLIGYIVARKDAVDLGITAQARLISAAEGGTAGAGGGSIPDAPLDGSSYGRNNGAWVKVVDQVQPGANVTVDNTNPNKPIVAVPSSNLVAGEGIAFSGSSPLNRLLGAGNLTLTGTESFRNKVINGDFITWQRAASLPAQSGTKFAADRWLEAATGSTFAISQGVFNAGQTDVPGNPFIFHRATIASVAGADNFALTTQRLENVQTFSGESAVLSFWAKADAPKSISVEFFQDFGVGGSLPVTGIGVQKVNLTTAWQKFTFPVTFPSVAGKTFGTNNFLGFNIFYDAGSNLNARTNSLGQQSGVFDIARVQFEPGLIATDFEQRPYDLEFILCQRFYQTVSCGQMVGQAASGSLLVISANLGTPVRGGTVSLLKTVWSAAAFEVFIGGAWRDNPAASISNAFVPSGTSISCQMQGFSGLSAGHMASFSTSQPILAVDSEI